MTVQRLYPISSEVVGIQVNTRKDIEAVLPEVWVKTLYEEDGTVRAFNVLRINSNTQRPDKTLVYPGQWVVAYNEDGFNVFDNEESVLSRYRRCPE